MKLLNSFWLKIIALITMIIDHSAIIFLSPYSTAYLVCRIIGRISLPIYGFLIIEGINYSKSPLRYLIRMLIIGLIFDLICHLFTNLTMGNTFTLFSLCGLSCYLLFHEDWKYKLFSIIPIGVITLCFLDVIPIYLEYGIYGIALMVAFFLSKELSKYLSEHYNNIDKLESYKLFSALSLTIITCVMYVFQNEIKMISPAFVMDYNVQTYSLIACFLILCYNGLRGYTSPFIKWGFYISYPLHILILLVINLLIR